MGHLVEVGGDRDEDVDDAVNVVVVVVLEEVVVVVAVIVSTPTEDSGMEGK